MKLSVLGQLFLKGAITLLPIVMTLTVLWWLVVSLETALGGALYWAFPGLPHVPGLGSVLAIILIFLTGLLVQIYVARWVIELVERLFKRIPFVGAVYGSFKDILTFISGSKEKDGLKKVVLVCFGEHTRVLGFVTQSNVVFDNSESLVAVYLPMSYQVGGYTVYMPESELEYINMSVEEAMRTTLTAHMTGNG